MPRPPPPRRAAGLALALLRSLATFAATTLGAGLLVLALLAAAPGDAADLQGAADPALNAALRARWGLDGGLAERALGAARGLLAGDPGRSLTVRPGVGVAELVRPALARSAPLLAASLALSMGLGVGLAASGAARLKAAARALSVAPVFLLGWAAMVGLNEAAWWAMQEGLAQRPAWFALPDTDSGFKRALAAMALALGSASVAEVQQACAAELSGIRASGYVLAARARGAAPLPHVLRNLLPALLPVAASRVAFLLGGLVVVETLLQLNGAGALLWQACRLRDTPLALGLTLAAAATVCGARLAADLLRLALDPRLAEGA